MLAWVLSTTSRRGQLRVRTSLQQQTLCRWRLKNRQKGRKRLWSVRPFNTLGVVKCTMNIISSTFVHGHCSNFFVVSHASTLVLLCFIHICKLSENLHKYRQYEHRVLTYTYPTFKYAPLHRSWGCCKKRKVCSVETSVCAHYRHAQVPYLHVYASPCIGGHARSLFVCGSSSLFCLCLLMCSGSVSLTHGLLAKYYSLSQRPVRDK